MRARTWLIFTALAISLLARTATAEEFKEKRFHIVPFVGWTFFDEDRQFQSTGEELPDDFYFGGRINARLSHLFLFEVAGGVTSVETCCDWSDWGHVSGNLVLSPATDDRFSPFLSLGGGWSRWDRPIGPSQDLGTYEAAAGLNMKLSDAIGLRFEARDVLASSPDHFNDIIVGMGLNLGFGDMEKAVEEVEHCPDADQDGVCDDADRCPNTPAGCRVDALGCPIDSDGDGICDGIDQCPNTRTGCRVDERGCPIDSDNDGVCDGLDLCPNTPAGVRVDKDGCPMPVTKLETELLDKGVITVRDIYFDTAKWNIKPESEQTLNELCTIFKQHPDLRIEIGGHADARGSEAYNQDLTEKRAESVLEWLRTNCADASLSNFTARGYGETRPVASNNTAKGMALNRRIEFKVLNTEVLKRSR